MVGFCAIPAPVGCASNLTEMNELAEITQHLLRSSPDALVVIDEKGQIRFANGTVTDLFGYEPDQLVGKSVDVLVPERFRARHGQHITGYVKKPRSREMGAALVDLYALRSDGTEFAAGIRLAPIRVGERLYVAAAIRDNTERKQINDALISARQEAEHANRAKSRFLATASHDLRQPLQTVRLLNAAMSKVARSAELADLLQHQERAIENATRLLNALLDISRLESGAIEPQLVEVSLPELFEELRQEFESAARARHLELIIAPAQVTLRTDRILFHQLLQNLVGNAIKYTDKGSVGVRAFVELEELKVVISDTGIGIPPDKLERIFDEYYQIDTQGAKRMGVGLGLAIVKEVARLLGYRVAINSRLGECTEAVISIPCELVSEVRPAQDEHHETAIADPSAPRRARVILVEDNEGVRVATELFLKLEGYEIISASSFAEVERVIPGIRRGDVIVADYHLDTSHTGLDVLANARRVTGLEIPGVVLSGDLPAVLRSIKTPVPSSRFLSKPVDTKALLEAITELSTA
jgi:PAS domain S-box-containing protein